MKQIFYNGTIVTGEPSKVIKNGYMVVENGIISEIGSETPHLENVKKIDLKGKWVMPGLINTHGHIGSALLRGYSDDLPLKQWLETKMWPMEAKFTEKTVKAGAELAILEMLKSGTTTFLEMYHLHLDMIANIVSNVGIRAVLTRGMIGLCSPKQQEQKLIEAYQLSESVSKQGEGRITSMLAPHAPYTCPPEFLNAVVNVAKEKQLPIHIHAAETAKEVAEHKSKYGITPVEHLQELGVFDQHCLIAHAVHLTEVEFDILAINNVAVSHNPISNLKLGSGIANVSKMIERNINVSLGTDSTASNNNLDMFQEMRMAALVHKGASQDPTIIPSEVALALATLNGAKSLCLENVGLLTEGYIADFITVNSNAPHLQPKEHTISHLVYSASGSDVVDVYINGKCIVRNREMLTIDEERVIYDANKEFNELKTLCQ